MPLISLKDFKAATTKEFGLSFGAFGGVYYRLWRVERAWTEGKWAALENLRIVIETFKRKKTAKYGNYESSVREGAGHNITKLEDQVHEELLKFNLDNDLFIARYVCGRLFDVKIADVDFSPNVSAAAKKKMIAGKSLYATVKDDWESESRKTDWQRHEMVLRMAKPSTTHIWGERWHFSRRTR